MRGPSACAQHGGRGFSSDDQNPLVLHACRDPFIDHTQPRHVFIIKACHRPASGAWGGTCSTGCEVDPRSGQSQAHHTFCPAPDTIMWVALQAGVQVSQPHYEAADGRGAEARVLQASWRQAQIHLVSGCSNMNTWLGAPLAALYPELQLATPEICAYGTCRCSPPGASTGLRLE